MEKNLLTKPISKNLLNRLRKLLDEEAVKKALQNDNFEDVVNFLKVNTAYSHMESGLLYAILNQEYPDLLESFTSIPANFYAYRNFGQNDSVDIPEGFTAIGSHAFYASNIYKVRIPKSVTELGERAFNNIKDTSMLIIEYAGTSSEWRHIKKGTGLFHDAYSERITVEIRCSDKTLYTN